MKPFRVQNRETSSRLGWRIEAKAGQADVFLYDLIGKDFWGDGTSAADFVQEMRSLDVGQIDLHINSPGGFVDDGLAMFHAIQQHPANVIAHVDGLAASAASFIAMAADQVLIAPHARMMIHDAIGMVDVFGAMNAGGIDTLIADMTVMRNTLDAESQNIADIYAEKAGGDASLWRNRMRANGLMGTTYRGQEAIDAGLANGIDEAPAKDTSDQLPAARHSNARAAAMIPQNVSQSDDDSDFDIDDLLDLIPPVADHAGYREPTAPIEALLAKHPLKVGGNGG